MTPEHRIELSSSPAQSLENLARQADAWGAEWRRQGPAGGDLELPVLAGLRYGFVRGTVTAEERARGGSQLTFHIEESHYRLQMPSVLFLLLGGFGGLLCLVGPFIAALRPMIPVGILLGVATYLFIIARLRNSGPEEFLQQLENAAGE